jgi:PST family polysaccharide transporter
MTFVFIGAAQLFANFGIGSAIVQSREVTATALASAFWANLLLAGALALGLVLAAPSIAVFYGDTRVTPLLVTLSLSLVLSGIVTVPQSILFKTMDFASIARAQVVGSLTGAAGAIAMAIVGFGVWSLVVQPLVGSTVTLLLMWSSASWWPRFVFSWPSIRQLVHFSAGVLGANILNYANRRSDDLLIGKFLGSGPLGYYSLAYQLMLYPLTQVSSVIVRVLFPTLSQLQDDLGRFRSIYLEAVSAIAMVTFPMMLGLLAISHDFIVIVFGEKWLPMELVLKIFCVIGLLQSVGTTVGTIYMSTGKTALGFYVTLTFTPFIILAFLVGLYWGIEGVATAYACVSVLLFYVSLFLSFRVVGISFNSFASLLMLLVVTLFSMFLAGQTNALTRLVSSILLGIIVYVFTLLIIDKRKVSTILGVARKALARS